MTALEAVFSWVLTTTWQASVLAALVLAAQWLLGARLNPRWRYALWMLVLLRLVLPDVPESALSLFRYAPAAPLNLPETIPAPEISPMGTATAMPIPHEIPLPQPNYTFLILAILWLGGALGLLLLTFLVNRRFARHVANAPQITDESLRQIFADAKAELGIRRDIRLVESSQLSSPAIMGLFTPTLLLPDNARGKFSPRELRFIFLHELAHLKRGDVFVQALIALLQVIHWFNPVLWYAFRRLRADREPATDALVLSRTGEADKEPYGLMLLKLLEHFNQRHALPTLVGILEDKDQFKRRFSLIAKFTRSAYGWSLLGVFVIAALAAVCLTKAKASASNSDLPPMSAEEAKAKGIVALVNGHPIYTRDIALRTMGTAANAADRAKILDGLINRELQFDAFRASGQLVPKEYIDEELRTFEKSFDAKYHGDHAAFVRDREKFGISPERDRQAAEEEYMRVSILESEVLAKSTQYFQDHIDLLPAEDLVNVTVIEVECPPWVKTSDPESRAAEQLAQQLLAQVKNGADFDNLARAQTTRRYYASPTMWLSKSGLFWPVEHVDALWAEAGKLQPGQVSGLVTGQTAFYILRLNERRAARVTATAETRKQESDLYEQQNSRQWEAWLAAQRAKAQIQIFDATLKEKPSPEPSGNLPPSPAPSVSKPSVNLQPGAEEPDVMTVRMFLVPSGFLKAVNQDQTNVESQLLARGIPFAGGSSAIFLPAMNKLVVRDTPDALDALQTLVEAAAAASPLATPASSAHAVAPAPSASRDFVRIAAKVVQIGEDDYQAHRAGIDAAVKTGDLKPFLSLKSLDMLSEPVVAMKSGEHGVIEAVREFPFPTQFKRDSSGSLTPTEFARRDIGVRFPVTAVIDGDKIGVSGELSLSTFRGWTKTGLNTFSPGIDTQDVYFYDEMNSGQTRGIATAGTEIADSNGTPATPGFGSKPPKLVRLFFFLTATALSEDEIHAGSAPPR